MSFLNQLKSQAHALRSEQNEQGELLDAKAAETETGCRVVLPYLHDLARQLTVIEPPGPALSLDGKTPWPAMKLRDFRVDARRKNHRNREATDYIAMGWQVVPRIGDPIGGIVSVNFPTDQQRVESRLALGMVKHDRTEIRIPEKKNVLQEVRYEYLTFTRGSLTVTPDHDRAELEFRFLNVTGFEVVTTRWPAARIDLELMDDLARYLLRQPNRFV